MEFKHVEHAAIYLSRNGIGQIALHPDDMRMLVDFLYEQGMHQLEYVRIGDSSRNGFPPEMTDGPIPKGFDPPIFNEPIELCSVKFSTDRSGFMRPGLFSAWSHGTPSRVL